MMIEKPLLDGLFYPQISSLQENIYLDESPPIYFEDSGLLEVTAENECGCTTNTNVYKTEASFTTSRTPIISKPFISFSISPNPAQDFAIVHLKRRDKEIDPRDVLNINCTITITEVNTGLLISEQEVLFYKNEQDVFFSFESILQLGVYVVKINSIYGTASKNLIIE